MLEPIGDVPTAEFEAAYYVIGGELGTCFDMSRDARGECPLPGLVCREAPGRDCEPDRSPPARRDPSDCGSRWMCHSDNLNGLASAQS